MNEPAAAGLEAANDVDSTQAAWDRIAPGYDKTNTPSQMGLGEQGLRLAGVRPGIRFLDVASGSGALSIPAARLGARVLATDLSPVMLELLSRRARAQELAIDTRVMDGHALKIDDGTFDVAGSQFGVMLFPDMPRGIREMARVVRPGGRVLMIAYGDPQKIDFLSFLVAAVQTVRPDFTGPELSPPPLPFQLQKPERLRRELSAAGLKEVEVQTIIETTSFESGDALWEWLIWSNPIVEAVLGALALSGEERETIRRSLDAAVRKRAGGERLAELTNPINMGIGTR